VVSCWETRWAYGANPEHHTGLQKGLHKLYNCYVQYSILPGSEITSAKPTPVTYNTQKDITQL